MSAMLCTGATFVKKNSCLVARIVPYYTAVLHLLTFQVLEPQPSKDIALGLSHINGVIIVHFIVLFESMLLGFPAAKI